ncbi:MAG: hypothetical protein WC708_00230 [Lentisphaeria bacterium]|jgi:hypothetical protein
MPKKQATFYVGTSSDPTLATKAVAGLRAMVRLGREAEKTLQDLKEQGYSDRRTYWLKIYSTNHRELVDSTFPKAVTLTRSDIPDYGRIEVCLVLSDEGGKKNNHPKSNEFHVMITAQVFHERVWEKRTFSIGRFRVTKRRGVFRPVFPDFRRGDAWKPNSISLTKDSHPRYKDRIAHALSEHIVGEKLIDEPYPAELARQIQVWLVEDGFIDKLIQYLWQFSKDQILVKRIMTE